MTRLYELKKDYLDVQKMVEEGVPIEELQDTLDMMQDDITSYGHRAIGN